MITDNGTAEDIVLRLEGAFEAEHARSVAEAIAGLSPQSHALVDFRRVDRMEDFTMACLADAIVGRVAQVSLVGLGRHHRRILGYFGLGEGAAAPVDDDAGPTAPA